MAFQIRKVGTNSLAIFTIQDLLGLLGDPVNDEVRIHGQQFRISSATELGDGGGNLPSLLPVADWQRIPLNVTQSGQSTFQVTLPISDPEGLLLVVNGAVYDHGLTSAFHVQGNTLSWHGPFSLDISDSVYLKYLILSFPNT